MRTICSKAFITLALLTASIAVPAGVTEFEPFREFDPDSKYAISYDDLSKILSTVVVDVGRSTREVAAPKRARTGTRMKVSVKRYTVNEANRFYYETFDDNEEARKLLIGIQKSLEQIPQEVSLKYFSREEQLAYWLNLYNVTLLNAIIKEYPKRDLKKLFKGKKSILDQKLLNVADIPLSLNDIQFKILRPNYDNDPLIIYGLHQGFIGSPNIRRKAYTGSDVYRALKNNASEFINSNRGTYGKDEKVFEVSSLYDRNRVYFPNFNRDLKTHLLDYIQGPERRDLEAASVLKPDIDDWTVADLGGTNRDLGAVFADSNAALLDSVKGTTPMDGGGVIAAAAGYGSTSMAAKGKPMSRIDPDLLVQLKALNSKRESTNIKNATVTVEEMGVPSEQKPDPDKKD